jgi:hypothetical protein
MIWSAVLAHLKGRALLPKDRVDALTAQIEAR